MNRMNITLISSVAQGDGEMMKTEYSFPCSYLITENAKYIQYDETLDENTSRCRVTVGADGITILRKGSANSKMLFIEHEETAFSYIMPFGSLDMTLISDMIRCELNNTGGELELGYRLFHQGEQISKNTVFIKIADK